MIEYKRLEEVTPLTGGIFTALQSFDVPWKSPDISAYLDMDYYGNYSGEKIVSPLVNKKLVEGVLTSEIQTQLAAVLYNVFGTNWTKEWETMSEEYDPIANYDMTEVMTDDETVIEYGKSVDISDSNTHTKTGTETETPAVSLTTADTVHGFNSSNAVPTDGRTETPSGTDQMSYNISEGDSRTIGNDESGSDTHTRNYTLTRTGNIGVTTTQQLLQSERDLWKWSYFMNVVFPDIDRVLTIQTY